MRGGARRGLTRRCAAPQVRCELDAAMQADAETMHERHEFTIHQLERWSKRGVMPVRVKVYLHAKLYGRTTGPTLVDILNRQSLKAKSPVMQGEI